MKPPLIIMIGGASFVGKSSISTRIAGLLHPNSIICTDYIRAAIRPYFGPTKRRILDLPTFRACEALGDSMRSRVIDGFLRQCRLLIPSVRRIVNRCLKLGESLVIEGIHLTSSLVVSNIELSEDIFYRIIYADETRIQKNMEKTVLQIRTRVPLQRIHGIMIG